MKQEFVFLLGILCIFSLTAQDFTAVIPVNATMYERTAAEELSEHLSKAVGRAVPIRKENETIQSGRRKIYIGKTALARKNAPDFNKMGTEEWYIKAMDSQTLIIGGGEPRGTVYAVYEFLEQEIGVVWADEHFTYVPHKKNYTWKKGMLLRGKPSYDFRGTYAYFKHDKHLRLRYMVRNRETFFTDDIKHPQGIARFGITRTYGSPRSGAHTFYFYTKDWGKAEEECLSMNAKGQRVKATRPRGPGQVCMTNPKTTELFIKKLKEYIAADRKGAKNPNEYPRIYMISQNDNDHICLCPNCKAFAKKHGGSGLLLSFVNGIAKAIRKDYPDIRLMTNAYSFAKEPSKDIKAEPNVIAQYAMLGSEFARNNWQKVKEKQLPDMVRPLEHPNNALRLRHIRDWGKISTLMIWDYWILYEDRRPYPAPFALHLANNLKSYKEMGVIGLMAECERPMETCFYALRLWLGYRFMNHTELDPNKEIDRFMNAYYGKAAKPMRQVLDYMQKRQDALPGYIGGTWVHQRNDFDDAYFKTVQNLLDTAEKAAAGDAKSLEHIGYERYHVDVLQIDRARCTGKLKTLPLDKLGKRVLKNHALLADAYLDPQKNQWMKNGMKYYVAGLTAKEIPLPAFVQKKDVIADITWPLFQQHYWGVITPDPEAAGGLCLKAGSNTTHKRGIQFGLRCEILKKNYPLTPDFKREMAADEKYHYYWFRNVQLSNSCYIWGHWTWTLQIDLSPYAGRVPKGTPVDVLLSMKVEGPDYFKGKSKKANAFSIDRVLIVRHDPGKSPAVKKVDTKAAFRQMSQYEKQKQYAKVLACACELEVKQGLTDADTAELCHWKGRTYVKLGKREVALQSYLAVQKLSSCPSYYCWSMNGAASLFSDLKKYPEERAVYEKILKKKGVPVYFRNMALINHAQSWQKEKKYQAALKEYREMKLVNCHPDLLLWKILSHGECLYKMGNCQDALQVLAEEEKIKTGNPNRHAQIHALRAEIYLDGLKNIPEAKKAIDKSNQTPRATWGKNPALTNRIYGKNK